MRKLFERMLVLVALLSLGITATGLPAAAATTVATTAVVGSVRDGNGAPISGANVSLVGVAHLSNTTDNAGKFAFADVPAGLYTIVVNKPGFMSYRDDNLAVFIGETESVNVALAKSSFSSLRTIASVSTNTPGVAQLNHSTAAIDAISNGVFADQGQTQVMKVLDETPGVMTFGSDANSPIANHASPGEPQIVQIRGALPYETESLIDGHPVSVGYTGTFAPNLISPALLQDVEVVKGPGSMPTEINYAIGGTVNYRTLEPTRTAHQHFEIGTDSWGALTTAFTATGSVLKHRLDYAAGYVTDGEPGPLHNYKVAGSSVPLLYGAGPWTMNGQAVAGSPLGIGAPPAAWNGLLANAYQLQEPIYACCYTLDSGYHSTSELAKLRYNFSGLTALTLSYLGGQSVTGLGDDQANYLQPVGSSSASMSIFAPPAGYAGSIPSGTAIPFDTAAEVLGHDALQQNLFQGEFRTAVGQTTVLARYYLDSNNDNYTSGQTPPTTWTAQTWGGMPLCPPGMNLNPAGPNGNPPVTCGASSVAPVMTYFNGQPVTYSTGPSSETYYTNDRLSGESLELSRMFGDNTYTLSYDRSHQTSYEFENLPLYGLVNFAELPPSAGQTFSTLAAKGNIYLQPRLTLNVADYAIQYQSHYTGDGGATWQDATHFYNAPRVALAWHPNVDTAWRLSAGSSIAPPYISLLVSPGSQPQPNNGATPLWATENANNGQISPETAFGYDLGVDRRIERSTSVSVDLYMTNLRNMFLQSTSSAGNVTLTSGAATGMTLPLYVQETENLGFARYEGIEAALVHKPITGFGYRLQGALLRAYTYNLPANFYCAQPGPGCTYNSNLAVIPNANFYPSGIAYNGIENGRVPYSTGYGEINYTGEHGQYYNVGVTYYGPNNSFNEPAFAVLSASARWTLKKGMHLQLSGDNLTSAYATPWYSYFGGVPVPLAHSPGQPAFGATMGGNYGPATGRLVFSYDL